MVSRLAMQPLLAPSVRQTLPFPHRCVPLHFLFIGLAHLIQPVIIVHLAEVVRRLVNLVDLSRRKTLRQVPQAFPRPSKPDESLYIPLHPTRALPSNDNQTSG